MLWYAIYILLGVFYTAVTELATELRELAEIARHCITDINVTHKMFLASDKSHTIHRLTTIRRFYSFGAGMLTSY